MWRLRIATDAPLCTWACSPSIRRKITHRPLSATYSQRVLAPSPRTLTGELHYSTSSLRARSLKKTHTLTRLESCRLSSIILRWAKRSLTWLIALVTRSCTTLAWLVPQFAPWIWSMLAAILGCSTVLETAHFRWRWRMASSRSALSCCPMALVRFSQ